MVGWSVATNRELLKRIAALLFALADLADRASLAPLPARALLLVILRQAESVAQMFVTGTARDLGVAMPPQACPDMDDPDDTTRLAYSLRVLALTLASLAAQAEYSASLDAVRTFAAIETLGSLGHLAKCRSRSVPAFDTS